MRVGQQTTRALVIFNSLLLLSLLLAIVINYQINFTKSIPIGSFLDSASESDSKINELQISYTKSIFYMYSLTISFIFERKHLKVYKGLLLTWLDADV